MKPVVVQGTLLKCSFGSMPAPIMVLPDKKVNAVLPAAVKSDHVPLVNILPFGMCSNPANPMVIAATAAALGVPTSAPCIPCTLQEWGGVCGTVKICGREAIHTDSKLCCLYGGEIRIAAPVQPTVLIG